MTTNTDPAEGRLPAPVALPVVAAIVIHLRNGRVVGVVANAPVRVLVTYSAPEGGVLLPGWGTCEVSEPEVRVEKTRTSVMLALSQHGGSRK